HLPQTLKSSKFMTLLLTRANAFRKFKMLAGAETCRMTAVIRYATFNPRLSQQSRTVEIKDHSFWSSILMATSRVILRMTTTRILPSLRLYLYKDTGQRLGQCGMVYVIYSRVPLVQ